MKRTNGTKGNGPELRTWGFIAGAAALFALLTVVLCVMGGVFNFKPREAATPAPVTTPSPFVQPDVQNTPASPSPTQQATPSPSPTPEEKTFAISVIAGKGGTVIPSGLITAPEGGSLSFTITPDEGYVLAELKVDGASAAAGETYTFTDIKDDHTLYAVFRLAPEESPSPSPSPTPPQSYSSPTDIG